MKYWNFKIFILIYQRVCIKYNNNRIYKCIKNQIKNYKTKKCIKNLMIKNM